MLLACSWSVLSFGPLARWPFASAQGRIRCPTLAPRAPPRDRVQKGKGLQLSQAAAQAITVVILWLTQHFGANPPTSRKCYRSTATTRMILSMLLLSFFPPFSQYTSVHSAFAKRCSIMSQRAQHFVMFGVRRCSQYTSVPTQCGHGPRRSPSVPSVFKSDCSVYVGVPNGCLRSWKCLR